MLNGVNASQHVPVDVGVAWRGCNRTLVDPSSSRIYHVHEVSVGNFGHSGVRLSLGPSERVEEVVDDFFLPGLHVDVEVVHGEDYAEGSILHALSLTFSWQMYGVHL